MDVARFILHGEIHKDDLVQTEHKDIRDALVSVLSQ